MSRPWNSTVAVSRGRPWYLLALTAALILALLPTMSAEANPNLTLNFLNPRGDVDVEGQRLGSYVVRPNGSVILGEIQVEVLQNDRRISGRPVEVSLWLDNGGDSIHLATTSASRGLANFGTPSVQGLGLDFTRDYQLRASSPVAADVRIQVAVWENVGTCSGGSCRASAARGGKQSVDLSGSANRGALLLSLLAEGVTGPECGAFPGGAHRRAPLTAMFDAPGVGGALTATVVVDRAEVNRETNNGASFYQICFQKLKPTGEPDGAPFWLSDCPPPGQFDPTRDGPCVRSRTKSSGGDVQLVVSLPAQDPWMR